MLCVHNYAYFCRMSSHQYLNIALTCYMWLLSICRFDGRAVHVPFLPRAHAQGVKQSILSVVCLSDVVVTKIAKSQVLGIYACCNYRGLVDIGEKLVSVCFELLNMAH